MALIVTRFDGAAPSGENLEYDRDFADLMHAAHPPPASQFDEATSAPDAGQIVRKAEAVLGRSHDLRAAVLYGYGALMREGLPGLAEATGYIRHCLETFWDSCHPQLDPDDDHDPTMRVNAVLGLSDPATILQAVRLAPLTDSASFGRITLRDVAIAEGEVAPPPDLETPPSETTLAAAFADTPPATLAATLEAARAIADDIAAIDAVFAVKLSAHESPDLAPLARQIRRAIQRIERSPGMSDPSVDEAETAEAGSGGASSAARAAPGEVRTQTDVLDALDRIVAYYRAHEPSSPVPVLLERAKRLVGADFMTIIDDMAPGGRDNVKLIGGLE